jgi:hypothetical protein
LEILLSRRSKKLSILLNQLLDFTLTVSQIPNCTDILHNPSYIKDFSFIPVALRNGKEEETSDFVIKLINMAYLNDSSIKNMVMTQHLNKSLFKELSNVNKCLERKQTNVRKSIMAHNLSKELELPLLKNKQY